jgi:hypothetical protein
MAHEVIEGEDFDISTYYFILHCFQSDIICLSVDTEEVKQAYLNIGERSARTGWKTSGLLIEPGGHRRREPPTRA